MVPVGATLTRTYFAVRTSPYTMGEQYDTWDDAVTAAQAAYEKRVTALAATAPWNADVRALARKAVYMETRWVMTWGRDVDGVGGSEEFMHERHPDVTALRIRASFKAAATTALRAALTQVAGEVRGKHLPALPTADQVRSLSAERAVDLARSLNDR